MPILYYEQLWHWEGQRLRESRLELDKEEGKNRPLILMGLSKRLILKGHIREIKLKNTGG